MSYLNSLEIATRKARTLADRAYSSIHLKRSSFAVRAPLTYRERTILRQLGPYLSGSNIVVYDIGAHKGDYSLTFAKLKNVAQVVSFEPIPEVFASTQQLLRPYSNVACFNVALGDEPGNMKFHLNASSSSSSLLPMADLHRNLFPFTSQDSEIEVEVVRLDEHVTAQGLPAPDVVKIDVQGFEERVIRGGTKAIQNAQFCIVEVNLAPLYVGAPTFHDIYELMRSLGFTIQGMGGDTEAADGRQVQIDLVFGREN